jgi:membrane protease YdiL (CAAX protease family)
MRFLDKLLVGATKSGPLDARTASFTLTVYLVSNILFATLLLVLKIGFVSFSGKALSEEGSLSFVQSRLFVDTVNVMSGLITVLCTLVIVSPASFKDRSSSGVACGITGFRAILSGASAGAALAMAFCALRPLPRSLHPISSVASHSFATGAAPFADGIMLVLLIPALEEFLFRGVLYGGFHHAFGAIPSCLITTAIFLFLHFPKSFETLISLTFLSLVALWFRLRFGAILTAIAVHIGFNSVISLYNSFVFGHQ